MHINHNVNFFSSKKIESPRRYVEGEVTIHYRSPVRSEAKEPLSEEELARRSAENMRRVYQEERRRKYLQELHDIDSRRHTDNFTWVLYYILEFDLKNFLFLFFTLIRL